MHDLKKLLNFKDLKLFLFPLLLIFLHETFSVWVFKKHLDLSSSIMHKIVIIGSATISFFAGLLSDKFCRKKMLILSFVVGSMCFAFLFGGKVDISLLIFPFFFAAPIARAALIDNHSHLSIKNLMCVSYIVVFIPWCFASLWSLSSIYYVSAVVSILTIVFLFLFKDLRDLLAHKIHGLKMFQVIKKKVPFLSMALLMAQLVFFLIIEKIEYLGVGTLGSDEKLYSFLGLGSLLGAILCLVSDVPKNCTREYVQSSSREAINKFTNSSESKSYIPVKTTESLLTLSYTFLLLMVFGSLVTFFYWNQYAWEISLGQIGIFGGFYLPLVTDRAAVALGEERRGLACGIIELIIGLATIIANIFSERLSLNMAFVFVLLIIALLAYLFQRKHERSIGVK